MKAAKVEDPDYAQIRSESASFYYDVAALRRGKVVSARDAFGSPLGHGACQNCGHALEDTLSIDSGQPFGVGYWKKHLPDVLACKSCGESYRITYVRGEGDNERPITGAEREALR
jgi:hypothetical protein